MTAYQLQKTGRIWQGISDPIACWGSFSSPRVPTPSLYLSEKALRRYASGLASGFVASGGHARGRGRESIRSVVAAFSGDSRKAAD